MTINMISDFQIRGCSTHNEVCLKIHFQNFTKLKLAGKQDKKMSLCSAELQTLQKTMLTKIPQGNFPLY